MPAQAWLLFLPVELLAQIFSYLDVPYLRQASETCQHLRSIISDPLLNPWRLPIARELSTQRSPDKLKHLSVLSTVPRSNFIPILAYATPEFILFNCTLPNLDDDQWGEAFRKRFLPSWAKIKKTKTWKEAYMRTLFGIFHRLSTNCTTSEAWSNYIIINRTGVANSTTGLARSFNPVALFDVLKNSANMGHLPTSVRLIVRLADVRVIMFGIRHRKTSLFVNPLAEIILHPPGVLPPPHILVLHPEYPSAERLTGIPLARTISQSSDADLTPRRSSLLEFMRRPRSQSTSSPILMHLAPSLQADTSAATSQTNPHLAALNVQPATRSRSQTSSEVPAAPSSPLAPISESVLYTTGLSPMQSPLPHPDHSDYPNYTPFSAAPDLSDHMSRSERDWRWYLNEEDDEKTWIGPCLIVAQLFPVHESFALSDPYGHPPNNGESFEVSLLHNHTPAKWASFGWADLWAIAPWLQERVAKRVDGIGLGIE